MAERPVAASTLILGGGWFSLLGVAITLYGQSMQSAPVFWLLAVGVVADVIVLVSGIAIVLRPEHHRAGGILACIFSVVGMFGALNLICLAAFFSFIGGTLAVAWRPVAGTGCGTCGREVPAGRGTCPSCGASVEPSFAAADDLLGALVLASVAGFLIFVGTIVGAVGPYPFSRSPVPSVLLGLASGLGVTVGGIKAYHDPDRLVRWAGVILAFSALSFFGAYTGCGGGMFGLLAGLYALASQRPRRVPARCWSCGGEIPWDANWCNHCGVPRSHPQSD